LGARVEPDELSKGADEDEWRITRQLGVIKKGFDRAKTLKKKTK